MTFYFLIVDQY